MARVFVTGATGFVGSHTVAAVLRAGHHVRALVRDPSRLRSSLAPHGVAEHPALEAVTGDVTDRDSVVRGLTGCDAVVHAAGVFTFDPRGWQRMESVNVEGGRTVLRAAVDAGVDPVVHVSTLMAILPDRPGDPVTADSPPTSPGSPGHYTRTKTEAERVARGLQEGGAPVTITYPGGVHGPHDPYMGENAHRTAILLRGGLPVVVRGAYHATDVRDLAALHVSLIEAGRGPRRYVAPGHRTELVEHVREVARLTGRRLPVVAVPAAPLLGPLRLLQIAQTRLPKHYPGDPEAAWFAAKRAVADCGPAERDLGITPRPRDETFADEVRWLADAGHVSRRLIGRLGAR